MTLRQVRDIRLWVEDTGGDGPPVVFSHGVLWSTRLFAPQVAAMQDRYRCIAYDHRGQGRSDDVDDKAIPIETVYEDQVALIESLGVGPVHLVGLSMGGMTAMRTAARRPDLVRSLTLLCTSAETESPEKVPQYNGLAFTAQIFGVRAVTKSAMKSLFGKTTLTDPARQAERTEWFEALANNRRTVLRALRGVIARKAITDELPRITAPTLVIVAEEDVSTPPKKGEKIHALIPGSTLVRIPRAGHSAPLEAPEAVTHAITHFLETVEATR